ncbi:hypothetical protein NA57DRAFT_76091 [Rhizodiscina lignyota]|uniref:Uncharacterized protein n=1 Tax=Rhizodiscina lignyota TaxID=1504668 RepID=A0A9P4IC55_9PEZI|nr:hypothetical protein NA57DRAFT_76091 [Rhizodiscina lignyota]
MRAALRLFAAVRPASKFLEPGAPTGLTGLYTHSSPRAALILLYSSTLDKLRTLPEDSVYRASTEALTKHRLNIVESFLPEGYEAWQDRVKEHVEKHKDVYAAFGLGTEHVINGRHFLAIRREEPLTDENDEWDGVPPQYPLIEGTRTSEERAQMITQLAKPTFDREAREKLALEPEPQLTTDQISQLEEKLGAGLIEEVIQVAQGEEQLVQTMSESKVWEDLVEPAPEGQWSYHERNVMTSTQKP